MKLHYSYDGSSDWSIIPEDGDNEDEDGYIRVGDCVLRVGVWSRNDDAARALCIRLTKLLEGIDQ